MIGRLRGRVLLDEPTGGVVLDVHGVGYDVHTPVGTVGRARVDANAEVELWIHTHVREDARRFVRLRHRNRPPRVPASLLGVPNVGSEDRARRAERHARRRPVPRRRTRRLHARLGKVPGIGKKTAERLVLEPQGKSSVA